MFCLVYTFNINRVNPFKTNEIFIKFGTVQSGWLIVYIEGSQVIIPGGIAQSVTNLATDGSLTADPGVVSSIPARSHTFVEIDHEIVSAVVLPSAESFKKGCCQLQAKVCS